MWRVIHGRIATFDRIRKIGVEGPSICSLCRQNEETLDHIFTTCPFTFAGWKFLLDLFDTHIHLDFSCNDMIIQAMNKDFSPQIKSLWRCAVVSFIWAIWSTRNRAIFENITPSPTSFKAFLVALIREANTFDIGGMYNSVNDLICLKKLGVSGRLMKAPQITSVKWIPPALGWIKCNTDGSAKGCPGKIAGGAIFRNCRGFVHGCFTVVHGWGFSFEAELLTAILAIEIAVLKGWNRLWIETDSSWVVGCFREKLSEVPWRFRLRWKRALTLVGNMNFCITHTYREANQAADGLSKMDISCCWWDNFPTNISSIVYNDLAGTEYFRFT